MKNWLIALAMLASSTMAIAAADKTTYSGEDLTDATVVSLVNKYAQETSQTPPKDWNAVLVLLNGRHDGFTRAEVESKIETASSVELMSDQGSFVLNVVTK